MTDLTRLGKYEIVSALGKGAMGIVYKGYDPHIDRHVAIKTIRKDLVDPDVAQQYMARFKNEARAAGRLTHPHIVAVYEFGEDDAVAYIAMEYVEGAGLREHLNRRETFDFAQLVTLLRQLLEALDFAHARGVVHRDIKPSNLIVTDDGRLKVADFGIARVDTTNLTQAGMIIGTPSYMSPEQCRGLPSDSRSDLWSVGVVMYELLTGEKPFRGTMETIAYKICHEEPPSPSTLSKLKLPADVDRLIATALAKAPEARFQSARDFRKALEDLAKLSVEVDEGLGTTVVNIGTIMLAKPAAPAWDDDTLRTAEHELARALGPMAKVIVRRAAAQTVDRSELCAILSDSITDPESRRRFVTAFNSAGGGQSTTGASGVRSGSGATRATSAGTRTGTMATPLEAAYVEQVTTQLAVYIGPIAQVLTKKAARESRTRAEFVRRCAENLGTQERAAFLRELGYE